MSDKVKEQGSIPVSKVQRAAKFISTGAKVGGNYVKHYAKKNGQSGTQSRGIAPE